MSEEDLFYCDDGLQRTRKVKGSGIAFPGEEESDPTPELPASDMKSGPEVAKEEARKPISPPGDPLIPFRWASSFGVSSSTEDLSKAILSATERWKQGQEVIEGVYIGAIDAARNEDWLKEAKITHILDCGSGNKKKFDHIQYLSFLEMKDSPDQDLEGYYEKSHTFIDEALQGKVKSVDEKKVSPPGRILIHCQCGISRSAAILISYLMVKGSSYNQALILVNNKRNCAYPNSSFREQLQKLDKKLIAARRKKEEHEIGAAAPISWEWE